MKYVLKWLSFALICFAAYAFLVQHNGMLTAGSFFLIGCIHVVQRIHFTFFFVMASWMLCMALNVRALFWIMHALLMGSALGLILSYPRVKRFVAQAGNKQDALQAALWDEDPLVRVWRFIKK